MYIISNNSAYNINFIKKISIKEYESSIRVIFKIPGKKLFVDIYGINIRNKEDFLEVCIQGLNYMKENYSNFISYDEFQSAISNFICKRHNQKEL